MFSQACVILSTRGGRGWLSLVPGPSWGWVCPGGVSGGRYIHIGVGISRRGIQGGGYLGSGYSPPDTWDLGYYLI